MYLASTSASPSGAPLLNRNASHRQVQLDILLHLRLQPHVRQRLHPLAEQVLDGRARHARQALRQPCCPALVQRRRLVPLQARALPLPGAAVRLRP